MKRRSLLQALGVSTLALLSSCLGRTDATGEYPTLLTLAQGGLDRPPAPDDGTGDRESGSDAADPGEGSGSADGGGGATDDDKSDDGGLGGGSEDEGGDDSDQTPPDSTGFDTDGLLADLDAEGIDNGSASVANGTLSISFDSNAADAREAERELRTVLEVVNDAITDPDAFDSAVGGIVIRFRRPDGSKARPVPVEPDWTLAYRAGDISMETYLERIRGNER